MVKKLKITNINNFQINGSLILYVIRACRQFMYTDM